MHTDKQKHTHKQIYTAFSNVAEENKKQLSDHE